ncbi:MAG: hypothetical protein V7L11_08175 [Nostoc sp.]|uniref:hypothetical protein n=1 Tax=Nostoc sp. TaxID=1180 RepID=UPI002FFAED92
MRSHCRLLRAANPVDAMNRVSTCRARIPGLGTGDWGLGTRKSFLLVRTLREQNLGSYLNPRTIFPVPITPYPQYPIPNPQSLIPNPFFN